MTWGLLPQALTERPLPSIIVEFLWGTSFLVGLQMVEQDMLEGTVVAGAVFAEFVAQAAVVALPVAAIVACYSCFCQRCPASAGIVGSHSVGAAHSVLGGCVLVISAAGVATLLSDAASSVAERIDPDSVAVATAASAEGATHAVRPSSSAAAGCQY